MMGDYIGENNGLTDKAGVDHFNMIHKLRSAKAQ